MFNFNSLNILYIFIYFFLSLLIYPHSVFNHSLFLFLLPSSPNNFPLTPSLSLFINFNLSIQATNILFVLPHLHNLRINFFLSSLITLSRYVYFVCLHFYLTMYINFFLLFCTSLFYTFAYLTNYIYILPYTLNLHLYFFYLSLVSFYLFTFPYPLPNLN